MKWRYIIFIITFILAIILLATVLFLYYKPHKNFAASRPDYFITSKQLIDEFEKNETESNKKYVAGNKTVQISGYVIEINKESDSTFTLNIGESANANSMVSCSFMKTENKNLKSIKKNDKITVKGQCTGFQGLIDKTVVMIRCALVAK